jgi:hypothetical protein
MGNVFQAIAGPEFQPRLNVSVRLRRNVQEVPGAYASRGLPPQPKLRSGLQDVHLPL